MGKDDAVIIQEAICLGLNPAVDVTYRIGTLVHGEAQRVPHVREQAGGKATNVARVVQQLGERAHLIAALGGPTGEQFAADLATGGPRLTAVATTRHTRRTVTIVEDDGTATALNEAGAAIPPAEWRAVHDSLDEVLAAASAGSVLVLSGSLPPGADEAGYAECVAAARAQGFRVIVDCGGPALLAAIAAGATHIKPNRHELLDTVGCDGLAGVSALRERSPGLVVLASDGPAGLICAGPEGEWRATPSRPLRGNPVGAGDAVVAAVGTGLMLGMPIDAILRSAVGTSGAAVLNPIAGHIDREVARDLSATVGLTRLG